jgi:hypothetical protein
METKFDCEISLDAPPSEFWASRHSRIRLKNIDKEGRLFLRARAAARDLYDYFPFNIMFYVNGRCVCIIEIEKADEAIDVVLPIYWGAGDETTLTILSELGDVPARRGLNNDVRELSACLTNFKFVPAQTPLPRQRPQISEPSLGTQKHFPLDDLEKPRPIFIIGSYRSGTSITTWAIGQHPNIFPMDETNWLVPLCYGTLAAYRMAASPARSATKVYDIAEREFLMWQGAAIDRLHKAISTDRGARVLLGRLSGHDSQFNPGFQILRSRFSPKSRWVDGTPECTEIASVLAEMFPAAKFIYLLRKPRDVMTSLINFHSIGGRLYSVRQAGDDWERLNRTASRFLHSQGRDRVMLALYDDLVTQPADLMDRIWNFIGEPSFHRSLETLSSRINSSIEKAPLVIDSEHMKNLNKIYQQIILDTQPDRIDWSIPAHGTMEAEQNDVVERVRSCFM